MPKPYTVKFGQWLPDLQDVGIEMPFQWTETELPVADCENVYYQDAAYRCLPAPAPIAPSLGIPVLACFTWYDNTAGKEVVFAATANGFYTLIDNVWTQVPVQQNASAGTVGYALSMALGATFAVAVALSPSSQTETGDSTSFTFSPVSASWGNGTPTGFNWTFSGQTGPGTWSIQSGQGDSAAAAQVTGTPSDETSTAQLNCAITINGVAYTASASLSYQNIIAPTQVIYTSGSGTQTVPEGYNTVLIEVSGGGQGGAGGYYNGGNYTSYGGQGGYSGAYCRSSYSCTAGETLAYVVGAGGVGGAEEPPASSPANGGTSTVSSGTLSITTMSALGGGVSGSPSGGNQANTGANAGTAGAANVRGTGGPGIVGEHITGAAGGDGGLGVPPGSTGGAGVVSFYFTYVP